MAPTLNARAILVTLLAGCTVAGTTRALAYYRRAKSYARDGDYDRAIAYYDTTLTLFAHPLASEVFIDRGVAYYWKSMLPRAIADFDTALSIYPEEPRALANRGAAYLDLKQPARALTDLSAALRLQPGITWARHRRARAFAALDSLTRAIADMDTVLVVWTNRPEVVAERARLVARARH
jgi:tetratricopeptide (TPR) repeat protein